MIAGLFRVLIAILLLTAGCARVEAPPTATVPGPVGEPEAAVWAKVRAELPTVPIISPTWLPPTVDRARVQLRGIGYGPTGPAADPRYTVAYVAPSGASITIALGQETDIGASKIGTRVRNSSAVLSFGSTTSTGPFKRIRWRENGYDLRIDTDFSGDDLLHIAWSLDRAGAPAPKNPYTRVKPGVCAARDAAPEETVRRLIGFVGSGDRDAVLDCFSLELLGDYPGYSGWADLPRASDVTLQPAQATGGRFVIGVRWQFASDPGGAWAQQPHQFFLLGLEDGSWRVFEAATAWYASPP